MLYSICAKHGSNFYGAPEDLSLLPEASPDTCTNPLPSLLASSRDNLVDSDLEGNSAPPSMRDSDSGDEPLDISAESSGYPSFPIAAALPCGKLYQTLPISMFATNPLQGRRLLRRTGESAFLEGFLQRRDAHMDISSLSTPTLAAKPPHLLKASSGMVVHAAGLQKAHFKAQGWWRCEVGRGQGAAA